MRGLFEAGLNEAAASLAASYGCSSRRGLRNALFRGVSTGVDCEVCWVAVAKLGDLATIFSGSLGDTLVGERIGRKFPGSGHGPAACRYGSDTEAWFAGWTS